MIFCVLTLFPEMVKAAANHSILKRASEAGLIEIRCVDIRGFSGNKHNRVDDAPYGGGAGMVMMPGPVVDACRHAKAKLGGSARVAYLTPQGRRYDQGVAAELAQSGGLILLCGHYEGVDQRALDAIGAEEISIGDYVLTGGELAALAVIDSVSRLIPGVLGKEESFRNESFSDGLLEHPHYTHPQSFEGVEAPAVLLSGHHKNIDAWRRRQSLLKTAQVRPDLLRSAPLGNNDIKYLKDGGIAIKAIITVLGNDQMGIIAKVCTFLSNAGINILDISQTIVQGYFNMMMIVDITSASGRFEELAEELAALGVEVGVQIKLQREDIFNSMHRI